ncbi:MAG TPA: DUF6364 family protein [Terriglobales bacterium]|nr:DUF6364 family protein [Terriglobales bacterium]
MKTTLDLDDELIARAKAAAARERITLTRMVEQGLRLRLRSRGAGRVPVALPVSRRRGGPLPGINPASNRSLLDAADRSELAAKTS